MQRPTGRNGWGTGSTIYLDMRLLACSSGLPASRIQRAAVSTAEAAVRRCLALHPVGFAWPQRSPPVPVSSYLTFAPLACAAAYAAAIGGSAFCCTCRRAAASAAARLPVRKHSALWCSDFPHRPPEGRRSDALERTPKRAIVPALFCFWLYLLPDPVTRRLT